MHYIKRSARYAAINLLRLFNPGDIAIRHHWTGNRIKLNAFQHKGYWWHGKRRELASMNCCAGLLSKGQTVIECGGHIGYLSLYFASLVGETGHVIVFEPGPNNLHYLKSNVEQTDNTRVEELAVGPNDGSMTLYVDDFTGQNNSLLEDYENIQQNSRSAGVTIHTKATSVDVVRLDAYCQSEDVHPDFVKMDIEGYELQALQGMTKLLRDAPPMLMIEVTENSQAVYELLTQSRYVGFTEHRSRIDNSDEMPRGNTFWLQPDRHAMKMNWMEMKAAA